MNTDQTSPHIFSADKAISGKNEDRLNRTAFAAELAKKIGDWKGEESLVVAIYGNWGEGKSSLKNLIKEEFETKKSPAFLEFNPWQWSKEDILMEAFFKELAIKLRQKDHNDIANKLLNYAEYLEFGKELSSRFKTGLQKLLLVAIGGASVIPLVFESIKPHQRIISIGIFVIAGITFALDQIIWFLQRVGQIFKTGQTLEERKKDLRDSLSKMNSTLVVILDDIDRLNKEEIRCLFRIIKANADFPNIVYLTLFQKDIVESSLTEDETLQGSEYLKKIIQIGFELPKVTRREIHSILFAELDNSLNQGYLDKNFDKDRLSRLWLGGAQYYFINIRDIKRFISVLSFRLDYIEKELRSEINPIDFLGMEVLHQFEPQVYQAVFYSKELMTSSSPWLLGSHTSTEYKNNSKTELENIIQRSSIGHQGHVRNILSTLFPNTDWVGRSLDPIFVEKEEYKNLRVNHKDIFDRYFTLFRPSTEFSHAEFTYILSIAHDIAQLHEAFIVYHNQGRLTDFLEYFEPFAKEVKKEDTVPLITALLNIGDYISGQSGEKQQDFFHSIPPLTRLKFLIHDILQQTGLNENEIESTYLEALQNATGIGLPVKILAEQINKRNIQQHPNLYYLSKVAEQQLISLLLSKIEPYKNSDTLSQNIHLPIILFYWLSFNPEDAKKWLNQFLLDDNNLISFLVKLEQKSVSSTGYGSTITYHIKLDWLQKFIEDLEGLFSRMEKLAQTYPRDNESVKRVFENIKKVEAQYRHPDLKENDFF